MINKPDKCCECGSYECQVPMPLNGRLQGIDYCIADIVAALNAANITTVASCCGHGVYHKTIIVKDLKSGGFFDWISGVEVFEEGKGNFYTSKLIDGVKYYFIPNVERFYKTLNYW